MSVFVEISKKCGIESCFQMVFCKILHLFWINSAVCSDVYTIDSVMCNLQYNEIPQEKRHGITVPSGSVIDRGRERVFIRRRGDVRNGPGSCAPDASLDFG